MTLYDAVLDWLAHDDCPIIVVTRCDDTVSVTGFRFPVDESALTEGIDRQEMVAKMVECHKRAEVMG